MKCILLNKIIPATCILLIEEILHQLIGSLSHYLVYRFFLHPRWLFGISSTCNLHHSKTHLNFDFRWGREIHRNAVCVLDLVPPVTCHKVGVIDFSRAISANLEGCEKSTKGEKNDSVFTNQEFEIFLVCTWS